MSMFAAAGVWPAVPLTGYAVFTRTNSRLGGNTLPRVTSFALMTVAGLVVWSVPLLGSVVAGIYRGAYVGLLGWGVTLVVGAAVLRSTARRKRDGEPSPPPAPAAMRAREKPTMPESGKKDRRKGSAPAQPAARTRAGKGQNPAPAQRPPGTAPCLQKHGTAVWNWVLALGLLVAAALYLGYPAQSIYGGRDEGVYAGLAVYIAHHGQLQVPYPWPDDATPIFANTWVGFPGFYKTQPAMTPQFGHLFSAWLAQAFATFGHQGLFRLNAVFALLSLAVFYGICRLAVPQSYAVVATLFLAFNPSQLWTARITLSEIYTQLFIWSGLLLLFRALQEGARGLAGWAGVFLALSAFVRFDG
ncbi:MAG: hypothetical protein ACE5I7_18805, partial [Candidatus Binatia bacterium]